MIIKTRRKNESLIKRLIKSSVKKTDLPLAHVLPQNLFESELVKEAFRSNRRKTDREFAVVTFDFSDQQATDKKLASLIEGFRTRLRISDVIGWFDLRLAVLLPETKKAGALLVANQLSAISLEHGIDAESNVAIYPWDDSLVAVADILNNNSQDDDSDGNDSGGDSHGRDAVYERADVGHDIQGTLDTHNAQDEYRTSSRFDGHDGHDNKGYSAMSVATQVLPQTATTKKPHIQPTLDLTKAINGVGNPLQVISDRTPRWKRTIDVVGAGTGLLMLTPVFAVAAVAIKVGSKGPVFFVQKREGKDGKEFGILKFRTMRPNAEDELDALRVQSEQDGPAFKLKNDPRITLVGKYLRKSCIDELPQLYNVLVGEMSLVGPRPLPVQESKQCEPWQRQRLSILPGLTCIWQAHGGRDIKFSEWMRMDMEYIRKRSLFYDLRLIFETAFLALLHRGSV